MFGIGFTEIVVIAIIALLVFGPEKLPEFTKKAGRLSGQIKRTSDQVRREIYNAMHSPAEEIKKEFSQAKRELLSVKDSVETEARSLPSSDADTEQNGSSDPSAEKGKKER